MEIGGAGALQWAAAMNQRGQAAVTDTVYFLLIVSGLCVFMFAFANQYGATVSDEITRSYYGEYTTSALKTILYASTSRNTQSIYDAPPPEPEIDHLLALVKEDYADDGNLTSDTQKILAREVHSVMRPVGGSFDYLFYINVPQQATEKYVFVFFHTTEPEGEKNYICKNASKEKTAKLLAGVGSTYRSTARIQLMEEKEAFRGGTEMREIGSEANLLMWLTTGVSGVFSPGPGPDGWGCASPEGA